MVKKSSKGMPPVIVDCTVSIPRAGEFNVRLTLAVEDMAGWFHSVKAEDIEGAVLKLAQEKLKVKIPGLKSLAKRIDNHPAVTAERRARQETADKWDKANLD